MNTEKTLRIDSSSSENTLELGERVGRKLRGGEVIELVSDLGGGKTTFTKGLAKGMGITKPVTSPSFTIDNEYKTSELKLHHLDFYRLNEAGLMKQELEEILDDDKNVVVIEWADTVADILPPDRFKIKFIPSGETSRNITFTCPRELTYLLENT
jgi:tRNA threonylcarbamoyladenosine biosynthesis protein TsaE